MKQRKYLTKSIFKIGLECPRKLYYHNKPDEYLNENLEDPFLAALARGGYQVGALAQLKYPSGIEIKSRKHEEAIAETLANLKEDNCVLFEAAFSHNNLFVRSDIIIKTKDSIRIIEVKSKSFENESEDETDVFVSTRGSKPGAPKLYSKWVPYLYDLAFQVYVARKQFPKMKVTASLMLLEKASVNPEEGLHQMFLVKPTENGGLETILTKKPDVKFKGHEILKEITLDELIDQIINGQETSEFIVPGDIEKKAEMISHLYIENKRFPIKSCVGKTCKGCEFRGTSENLKSGFDECWVEHANLEAASSKVMSFDLWNYRKTDDALEAKKYLLKDLTEDELGDGKTASRQLIIIEKERTGDKQPWIDKKALMAEMDSWVFPLHFIDFETCAPALPFKKGFPPYAEIAFQFSHHIMHKNGKVEHVGEFIDLTPGKFASFDFIRELKSQLENDKGTIFRYSSHENSVLNRIIRLLELSNEKDKIELTKFIKTITNKKGAKKKDDYLWKGDRDMVDLLVLVQNHYYSSMMGNSNSLKYVLPTILNESKFLQEKYSKPIYGTNEYPSKNFKAHSWLSFDGKTYSSDPYKELPPLFSPEELTRIEGLLTEEESIRNGGAAMMAYSKTQFTEMTDFERESIRKSLLKYCELDTLAMVMLVEYWMSVVNEE